MVKAQNKFHDPAKLRRLVVDLFDAENWSDMGVDVKGDAYEGLLEKNAQDTKSGADQYFTLRPLIAAMLDFIAPKPGETIGNPACGTGGVLLAAHDHVAEHHVNLRTNLHVTLKTNPHVTLAWTISRSGTTRPTATTENQAGALSSRTGVGAYTNTVN